MLVYVYMLEHLNVQFFNQSQVYVCNLETCLVCTYTGHLWSSRSLRDSIRLMHVTKYVRVFSLLYLDCRRFNKKPDIWDLFLRFTYLYFRLLQQPDILLPRPLCVFSFFLFLVRLSFTNLYSAFICTLCPFWAIFSLLNIYTCSSPAWFKKKKPNILPSCLYLFPYQTMWTDSFGFMN
jgi:hypothetical protein